MDEVNDYKDESEYQPEIRCVIKIVLMGMDRESIRQYER